MRSAWIGTSTAAKLLETSTPTAVKILNYHNVPSRQLTPGEKYRGRVQYLRDAVTRLAENFNSQGIK